MPVNEHNVSVDHPQKEKTLQEAIEAEASKSHSNRNVLDSVTGHHSPDGVHPVVMVSRDRDHTRGDKTDTSHKVPPKSRGASSRASSASARSGRTGNSWHLTSREDVDRALAELSRSQVKYAELERDMRRSQWSSSREARENADRRDDNCVPG